MNILFLSNRSRIQWTGPYYSIPAQVNAQAQIDNVLWINENRKSCEEWKKELYFRNLDNISSDSLQALPAPFNTPDIAIVEEIYTHRFSHIIRDIQRAHIPYIIVPRSQLTQQGQKRKPLKKWLGNLLYYKRLVRKAVAIQYLTKQEKQDSGANWNKNSFVLPNGINLPNISAKTFSNGRIQAVYIGRLEKYQKGLDLLLQACQQVQDKLRDAHFTLHIYGPNNFHFKEELLDLVTLYGISDFVFIYDPVFNNDKIKVLQQSDAFIMTSRFEGHPMGLIEALAYGLPCLVTTGTNMREKIDEYNSGWTADTTVESIAASLTQMLKEYDQFAVKSVNARRLSSTYDWTEIAKKSHQIYEKILRGNS